MLVPPSENTFARSTLPSWPLYGVERYSCSPAASVLARIASAHVFSHVRLLRCRGLQGPASEAQISHDAAYLTVSPIRVACPSPQNDPRTGTGASLSRIMQSSVTRPTPPLNLVRLCTVHPSQAPLDPTSYNSVRKALDDATVVGIPRYCGWMRKFIDKRHPCVCWSNLPSALRGSLNLCHPASSTLVATFPA